MRHSVIHSLLSADDEILHENFTFRSSRHCKIMVRMKSHIRLPECRGRDRDRGIPQVDMGDSPLIHAPHATALE